MGKVSGRAGALGCRIREDVLPGEARMVTTSKDADARLTQRLTTAVFAVCYPTGGYRGDLQDANLTEVNVGAEDATDSFRALSN